MNNKSADELDRKIDGIFASLFAGHIDYMITEDEAKSNLKSLIQAEVRKAITITLKEIKWVEYPPSGKEYHFKSGGWSNSLTDATNRIKALTKSKQEE